MLVKMRQLLEAVVFLKQWSPRRVTVGEVARFMKKPQSTVHRHMVKACELGLVQAHQFARGNQTCYEFTLTPEGNTFINSFIRLW